MTVTRFPRVPAEAAAAEASFVVNTLTGCVISAGPLAARVLGWSEAQSGSHALDAAMPAVSQLRRFAKAERTLSPVHQLLVWWVRKGSATALCRLQHQSADASDPLVRVTFTNILDLISEPSAAEAVRAIAPAPSAKTQPAEAQASAPDLRVPRDDRETLQLIARRIEEGVKGSAPPDPAPPEQHVSNPTNYERAGLTVAATEGSVVEDAPGAGAKAAGAPPAISLSPKILEANDNPAPNLAAPQYDAQEGLEAPSEQPADISLNAASQAPIQGSNGQSEAELAALFAKTAHDIKTPLSAISAASEIIRDERLGPAGNERYRAYAADIHASARHALAIVDRLMKMPPPVGPQEKPAAPEPEPARATPVDLNAIVSGCAAELRPLIEAQYLDLTMRLDASAPFVRVDAVGLKQSLLNILSNAMKFTPSGGTIHVQTERLASGTSRISVRDTGRGMTKGAIARALDAGDDAAAPRPTATGLGIGLPQVRAFCREAGAGLMLDSTLGHGTTATLTFPG